MTRDRRTSTGLTTVNVVIGHGQWIDGGFEIIGVFAAKENPDGWDDAYLIEEAAEYSQIRGW